ncbi:MAG: DUF433 domain-containing protein [Anaerolineaceae bacterium]|nr:DUF433 domain-containing protein [Anaerolineaceae bacterium]
MADSPVTEVIPIITDQDGRMRVSGTRVLLDLIVHAYHQGETPEHIVQMYPTLTLDKVYLAIGYYLRHRDAVDTYIQQMQGEAAQLQAQLESDYPPKLTRSDLRARLQSRQNDTE